MGEPQAEAVLEVRGAPCGGEEALLLYLENARRSGGGPVRSCQRIGGRLYVTFSSNGALQGVLARAPHRPWGWELKVRRAPPWDPTALLLSGAPPEALLPLLPPNSVSSCHPMGGGTVLLLARPVGDTELPRLRSLLPGSALLQPLPLSRSVSVEPPAAPLEALLLYLENRRSGGGKVAAVRRRSDGGAIVTFRQRGVVPRLLRRTHRLHDVELRLLPSYPALRPGGGDPASGDEGGEPESGDDDGDPESGDDGGDPVLRDDGGDPVPGDGADPVPGNDGGDPVPGVDGADPVPGAVEPADAAPTDASQLSAELPAADSPAMPPWATRDPAVTPEGATRDPVVTPGGSRSRPVPPQQSDGSPAGTRRTTIRDPAATPGRTADDPAVPRHGAARHPGAAPAAQERVVLPEATLRFLRRPDVRARLSALLAAPPCADAARYAVRGPAVLLTAPEPAAARRAARRLQGALAAFAVEVPPGGRVPGPGSPCWRPLRCCAVRPSGDGRWVQGLTLSGMEDENRQRVREALRGGGGEAERRRQSGEEAAGGADPDVRPSEERGVDPDGDPSSWINLEPSADPHSWPSMEPNVDPDGDPNLWLNPEPSADPHSWSNMEPNMDPNGDPSSWLNPAPIADPHSRPILEPTAAASSRSPREPDADPGAAPDPRPIAAPPSDPGAAGGPARAEAAVPMAGGAVRFLREQRRELLDAGTAASVLPLRGSDGSDVRLRGEPWRCRTAADSVRSLAGTGSVRTVRLRIPGIARFPQADAGRRVEERQRCVLEPRDVRGHLPEPQLRPAELRGDGGSAGVGRGDTAARLCGDREEAEAAALGDGGSKELQRSAGMEREEEEEEEEEAQLAMALQRSMKEEEEEEEEEARLAMALQRSMVEKKEEEEEEEAQLALQCSMQERKEEEEEEEEVQLAMALQCSMEEKKEEEEEEEAQLAMALQCSMEEKKEEEEEGRLAMALQRSMEEEEEEEAQLAMALQHSMKEEEEEEEEAQLALALQLSVKEEEEEEEERLAMAVQRSMKEEEEEEEEGQLAMALQRSMQEKKEEEEEEEAQLAMALQRSMEERKEEEEEEEEVQLALQLSLEERKEEEHEEAQLAMALQFSVKEEEEEEEERLALALQFSMEKRKEEEEEEEEAQLVLALQRSMEKEEEEEEEAQLALQCSMEKEEEEEEEAQLALQRSMEKEEEEEEEAQLALQRSMEKEEEEEEEEEAQPAPQRCSAVSPHPDGAAEDAAELRLLAASQRDVGAVLPALQRAELRTVEVRDAALAALPDGCLAMLRRRHGVQLRIQGCSATLRGFGESVGAAERELRELLSQGRWEEMEGSGRSSPLAVCWVRWMPCGTAVPYSTDDGAVLEALWQRRERRVPAVLGGRSVSVDLQRMEERDGTGTTALLTRNLVPPALQWLLSPDAVGASDAVRLLPLAEGSTEFGDAVRLFYGTLQELRGRIRVIRAQQLIHPRLYGRFRRRRAEMERRGEGGSGEQLLFHGTTAHRGREICLHGFRGSPRSGSVPFALTAALAAQELHSPTAADGTKCVLVAKVVTGSRASDGTQRLWATMGPYGSHIGTQRPALRLCHADGAYPLYLLTCWRHGTHWGPAGP